MSAYIIIIIIGVERDNADKQSAIIISTSGTTNFSNIITLTGLQDNTVHENIPNQLLRRASQHLNS